jgi:hypothetical protein
MDAEGACGSLSGWVFLVAIPHFFIGQLLTRKIVFSGVYVDDTIRTSLGTISGTLTLFLVNEDNAVRALMDCTAQTGFHTRGIITMHTGMPEICDAVHGFIFQL